jgi:hypothetical protein
MNFDFFYWFVETRTKALLFREDTNQGRHEPRRLRQRTKTMDTGSKASGYYWKKLFVL